MYIIYRGRTRKPEIVDPSDLYVMLYGLGLID